MGGEKLKAILRNFSRRGCIVFAAAFFIFFTSSVSAQVQELPPESSIVLGEALPQTQAQETASVWIVLRMVLVLALAALAIYGVVFFIKRLSRSPEIRDPYLKVLARVPLGTGVFAAVVSVGSRAWLVGGGEGGLSLIAEIDEREALESMLLEDARKTAESGAGRFPDFLSLLKKLGKGSAENREGPGNSHAEALKKQRERLKGL